MENIILIFVSAFCSFFLLQYLHCYLVKDRYWKYIIINSLIVAIYLWLLIWTILINEKNTPFPVLIISYFFVWIVIVPSIYSIIKKHFIMDHPKIATWHYPIFDFFIFIFGFYLTSIMVNIFDLISRVLFKFPII